jgi:hypothetical protein
LWCGCEAFVCFHQHDCFVIEIVPRRMGIHTQHPVRVCRVPLPRCFVNGLRRTIFASVAKESKIEDDLYNFLKSVPEEYKENRIPNAFKDLELGGLAAKAMSIGDARLSLQLSILVSSHAVLMAASTLAMARGGVEKIGEPGGGTPINEAIIKMLSGLRGRMTSLSALQKKESAQQAFHEAEGDSAEMHLAMLDRIVQPVEFMKMAYDLGEAELTAWRSAWAARLQTTADDVNDWVPAGVLAHKDTILDEGSAAAKTALLNNVNYTKLAETCASLGVAYSMVKTVSRDGCGAFLEPVLLNTCRQAIEAGTACVAITYAVFNATQAIPALPTKVKKQEAVKALMQAII